MEWTANGIQFALKNGKLHMVVDVSDKAIEKGKRSKSGESKIVATTGGWMVIPGTPGLKINFNVLMPVEPETVED